MADLFGAMCEVLAPFASPAWTSREAREKPELDVMRIEVTAGDWTKLCVLAGRMDGEYLRLLGPNAMPSPEFLAEVDELSALVAAEVDGRG